ncbi:MAG: cyclodeaminase/cyclohydrolase family protein [Clostridium sp.]
MYLDVFNNVINSDDFTVGGGSASALAGAMAAGMVSMVAKLSIAKPVTLTVEDYQSISKEADELAQILLKGSVSDTEAYCMIKDAFALPKSTDEEKAIRKQAVQDAAYQAAVVPMTNGYNDKKVYDLACRLINASNPGCTSDLMSAKYLSEAGVKGCALNIEANLSMIKDEARINELTAAMEELKKSV